MKHAQEYLIEKDIRPSAQRVAVMKYLLEHKTHPTVDEIYAALNPGMPTLSKTTIYNTLHLFAEKGAIHIITIDPKQVRFDADMDHAHVHFHCQRCGAIHDIPCSHTPPLPQDMLANYEVSNIYCYLHGLCPDCKRLQTNEKNK